MVTYGAAAEQFAQDVIRQNIQEKLYHYYNGNSYEIQEYLKDALSKTFDSQDIDEFQLDWVNITKKLVNQLAVVYREPATRTIIGKDRKEIIKLSEYYNSILPVDINTKDKVAHRYAKLFNTSLTRIYKDGDKFNEQTLPSYLYEIETDPEDFYKITSLAYRKYYRELTYQNKIEKVLYRIVWTDKSHYRQQALNITVMSKDNEIETWGDPQPIPGNPEMINPFEIIPFVPFRIEEQGEDFWGEGMCDVVANNEVINILLTDLLNEQIIMGSVGTVLAVNLGLKSKEENGEFYKKVRVGRKHPLVVEDVSKDMADPRLEYVSTNPVIEEIRNTVDWKIKMIALARGLNPNSFLAEVQATSGFSKVLDALEMIELRKDDIEPCRVFEDRRFEVRRKLNNYYKTTNEGNNLQEIPEDVYLKVDFGEISQPKTVDEQIKINEFELKNDLTTPIKIAKRDNPDLEDEEIEEEIMKNKEVNDRLNPNRNIDPLEFLKQGAKNGQQNV